MPLSREQPAFLGIGLARYYDELHFPGTEYSFWFGAALVLYASGLATPHRHQSTTGTFLCKPLVFSGGLSSISPHSGVSFRMAFRQRNEFLPSSMPNPRSCKPQPSPLKLSPGTSNFATYGSATPVMKLSSLISRWISRHGKQSLVDHGRGQKQSKRLVTFLRISGWATVDRRTRYSYA